MKSDAEKLGGAIMALKLIANTKPATHYVETSYNNGYNENCHKCDRMILIAKEALKELEN